MPALLARAAHRYDSLTGAGGEFLTVTADMTGVSRMPSTVMALVRPDAAAALRLAELDLKMMANANDSTVTLEGVELAVVAECRETAAAIADTAMVRALCGLGLHHVRVSDLVPVPNGTADDGSPAAATEWSKVVTVRVRLPENTAKFPAVTLQVLELTLQLVDHVTTRLQVSDAARARASKRRAKAKEETVKAGRAQREQDAQERKQNKLLEERKRAERMGEAELAKWEAREAKRQMKKRMAKGKMVMMK